MEVTSFAQNFNIGTVGRLLGFNNNTDLKSQGTHMGKIYLKFLSIKKCNLHYNLARGMIIAYGDYKHKETYIDM